MIDYQEKFIEAEKQASELIDNLSSLKAEINNYSVASSTLNDVRIKLSEMIDDMSNVSASMRDTISAIKEIDTKKIIYEIDANQKLTTEISEKAKVIAAETGDINNKTDYMNDRLEKVATNVDDIRRSTSAITEKLSVSTSKISDEIKAIKDDEILKNQSNINKLIDDRSSMSNKLQIAMIVLIVITIVFQIIMVLR